MITLDNQQQTAVDLVCNKQNVFLTGGGGTGKSRVLEYIIDIFTQKCGYNQHNWFKCFIDRWCDDS